MASSTSDSASHQQATPRARRSKAVTPPKGRPTRGRGDVATERRVFGPTAQWIALAVLIAAIVVVLIIVTGGGEFSPLPGGGHSGSIVLSIVAALAW